MPNQSTRLTIVVFFLICAAFTFVNANLAIAIAVAIGVVVVKKFGLVEYSACAIILLAKSQNEIVLSSVDLAASVVNYKLIATGRLVFDGFHWGEYENGEIILPTIYWVASRFFPATNESILSFVFVLSFLIFFYQFIRRLSDKPIVLLCVVLFLDVNLIVHLFRQSIASVFLLLGLMHMLSKSHNFAIWKKGYLIVGFSFLTHLTSVLFYPFALLFNRLPLISLKMGAIIAGYFAFSIDGASIFKDVIASLHGLPIVGKMSYALVVYDGEAGIRPVALIAIALCLIIRDEVPYLKVFLGFSVLMLMVYDVPILSTRVGLIGTSILTGLPIGIVAMRIRSYFLGINGSKSVWHKC